MMSGMFRGSWTIFRLGRIPVRLHWSLLLILPYLAFVIGDQFAAAARMAGLPARATVLGPYVWGVALAVSLFLCVLLHELSHVAVGVHAGAEVQSVTLMMLGGVTQMTRMPARPVWDGLMALAGPAASGVLGLAGVALWRFVPAALPDVKFGAFYLGEINLALAAFNLLPAFPMDGGRILRAILQPVLGRVRATEGAALVGKILAVLLAIGGLYVGNILLLLIAVFVFAGAGVEARQAQIEDLTRRFTVGQVMDRHPPIVESVATTAEVAARIRTSGDGAFFVVAADGRLLGGVLATQLFAVPDETGTPVTTVMQAPLPTATPDEPLETALRDLAGARFPRLPVVDGDGRLLGALGPEVLENLRRGRDLERRRAALFGRRREA